ncbi:MAG TPA: hybrid sensor histidine kinase/response regulator, partial [Syntrophobacteria bacterium]|nr:hybrid sensor histidine kinase/response regulator [Syntrophobacteria bacterium]
MRRGEKLKILVVDDNPAVNDILCQLCGFLGHEVVPAQNGAEGLALIQGDPEIAMVFTDFMMPV